MIRVEGLVKKYNSITAVDGIDFNVEKGSFFGFLGPNGAGKTTTIGILCTLLKPTYGSAFVNGFNCYKEPKKVRSSIGLVFQEYTLDNELTAYENLMFHCYLYGMRKSTAVKRIDEILSVVELNDRKDDIVKKFSGGMKRRLEIARGLLHRPQVLFLDEPTLGLDPQTRIHIWDFINRLRMGENITVFLTTHYMDEAEGCDSVAIIDKGSIISFGSPDELKKELKGDTIYLKTADDSKARTVIQERFGITVNTIDTGLAIQVEGGEKFLPHLFNGFPVEIVSVNLKRPSLNDVFVSLTGREIREDGPGDTRVRRGGR